MQLALTVPRNTGSPYFLMTANGSASGGSISPGSCTSESRALLLLGRELKEVSKKTIKIV